MSEQHILSAFEAYGDGWALVDALTMREDVRNGVFCREPDHREAKSDRFVLLVAWAMLVSNMLNRHFRRLRPGELCLGQLAEVVDSGQKIDGNGRESEKYLQAALGGLAGTANGYGAADPIAVLMGYGGSKSGPVARPALPLYRGHGLGYSSSIAQMFHCQQCLAGGSDERENG